MSSLHLSKIQTPMQMPSQPPQALQRLGLRCSTLVHDLFTGQPMQRKWVDEGHLLGSIG